MALLRAGVFRKTAAALASSALLGVVAAVSASASPPEGGAVWSPDGTSVRIPARLAYSYPTRDDVPDDSSKPLRGWGDPGKSIAWYGELKNSGDVKAVLRLRLGPKDKVMLRLTAFSGDIETRQHLTAVSVTATATGKAGGEATDIAFPVLHIAQRGYTRFSLQGVKRSGATFGDVASLALSGDGVKDAHFNTTHYRSPASVHLHYPNPEGGAPVDAYYNEVTAERDPLTTYYCAIGWNRGYMGYQINSPTERRIIFSVWDASKEPTDPNKVATEDRAQWLAKGAGVVAERFGNEGTGGHSHLVYPWKTGNTYRFLVTSQSDGASHVIYSGYFYFQEKKAWGLIGRIRTPLGKPGAAGAVPDASLKGFYSFDEDWSGAFGDMRRLADFGPEWAHTTDGKWTPLLDATFTHTDRENMGRTDFAAYPNKNGRSFALATGGYVGSPEKPVAYGDKLHRATAGVIPADVVKTLASPPAGVPVTTAAH